jgi:hypothetical protein
LKRVGDLPLKHRIWLAIVLVAVVMFVLMIVNRLVGEDEAAAQAKYCVDIRQQEEIRALTFQGINQGLVEKVSHLFDIWVSDPHEQPKRATVGMDSALSAYIRARANAEKWSPPSCTEEKSK